MAASATSSSAAKETALLDDAESTGSKRLRRLLRENDGLERILENCTDQQILIVFCLLDGDIEEREAVCNKLQNLRSRGVQTLIKVLDSRSRAAEAQRKYRAQNLEAVRARTAQAMRAKREKDKRFRETNPPPADVETQQTFSGTQKENE